MDLNKLYEECKKLHDQSAVLFYEMDQEYEVLQNMFRLHTENVQRKETEYKKLQERITQILIAVDGITTATEADRRLKHAICHYGEHSAVCLYGDHLPSTTLNEKNQLSPTTLKIDQSSSQSSSLKTDSPSSSSRKRGGSPSSSPETSPSSSSNPGGNRDNI